MSTGNALWRVRGEDSVGEGRPVEFPVLAQVAADGILGEEDQVRGPGDREWVLAGEHPLLAEHLPEQPLLNSRPAEEAEMDMTPMIDVTFQLLIFFMITAAFIVQKTLDMPTPRPDDQAKSRVTTESELKKDNIMVKVQRAGTVLVNDQAVEMSGLLSALKKAAMQRDNVEMVMDVEDDVEHEIVVQVLDAAGGAQIERVLFVQRVGAGSPAPGPKAPPSDKPEKPPAGKPKAGPATKPRTEA